MIFRLNFTMIHTTSDINATNMGDSKLEDQKVISHSHKFLVYFVLYKSNFLLY